MKAKTTLDEERQFNFNELFFSTTDLSGRILSWNYVFQRVSGFSGEEMLNKPHSLIRHPDMPRAVFSLLWEMLGKGKLIGAYVKNLAKDGKYYWVYALAIPVGGQYLSIRLKPASKYLEVVKGLYKELLKWETEQELAGKRKADVAEASKQILLQRISGLGFSTYEDFMYAAFPEEIALRDTKITRNSNIEVSTSQLYQSVRKIQYELNLLFDDLYKAVALSEKVTEDFSQMQYLASSIKLGALNAVIEASRLGQSGDTLFILANYLGTNGQNTLDELSSAQVASKSSLGEVSRILFYVCCAKLQTEMLITFIDEIESTKDSTAESVVGIDRIEVLLQAFSTGIEYMTNSYSGLRTSFFSVLLNLEDIQRLFVGLKIAHVAAKAEASRITFAERFGQVFDDVCAVVEQGRNLIDKTSLELQRYIDVLNNRETLCSSVSNAAKGIVEERVNHKEQVFTL